ncbi:hypothetical protein H5410_039374 [Solanum commersonii]|uniref:Uncharacterized protein n=1 Tax=Solanum commersonii TaxID=4109 RepID=A0A9J5YGL3_SOLCO|nr:hypothetical protein H5410_039374 [Solanum commersonii]
MDPVSPDSQNGLFSRSNDPRSKNIPHFADFCVLIVHGFLVIRNSNVIFSEIFHGLHGFLAILNSNVIFAEIFHGRPLRPYLWTQFSLTAKTAHFQGQLSLGAGFNNDPSAGSPMKTFSRVLLRLNDKPSFLPSASSSGQKFIFSPSFTSTDKFGVLRVSDMGSHPSKALRNLEANSLSSFEPSVVLTCSSCDTTICWLGSFGIGLGLFKVESIGPLPLPAGGRPKFRFEVSENSRVFVVTARGLELPPAGFSPLPIV